MQLIPISTLHVLKQFLFISCESYTFVACNLLLHWTYWFLSCCVTCLRELFQLFCSILELWKQKVISDIFKFKTRHCNNYDNVVTLEVSEATHGLMVNINIYMNFLSGTETEQSTAVGEPFPPLKPLNYRALQLKSEKAGTIYLKNCLDEWRTY